MANPEATYKVLVNGRAGGFRHQSIVDFEALIQDLGIENGFDVEVWDPNINATPGRQAPPEVSLPTSPFMNLETLRQYKTVVFNSTVGRGAQALNAIEFANLQQYIREGGGFIAIHGATDSMQNVPWYMDLVGAGFTNHGGNAGGILIDTESGGHVELINADRPARDRRDPGSVRHGRGGLQHQSGPRRDGHRPSASCTRTRTRWWARSATARVR